MRALNVGCGSRFHSSWENVDFFSVAPGVRACDLRKGIPYNDATFDVVYHSHLLEHFSKQAAPGFVKECFRVLKPGGVMRIAVPDLEAIVRLYLEAWEKASQGKEGWEQNYDWMVLEMYDQTVRESSGGECGEYFRQRPIPNRNFVLQRMGVWGQLLERASQKEGGLTAAGSARERTSVVHTLRRAAGALRRKLLQTLLGPEDWNCLQKGRFRASGEIHMWMYDSYSLARLLTAAGFHQVQRQTATESRITDWQEFHLDTDADGRVYKADSLYMEAVRP